MKIKDIAALCKKTKTLHLTEPDKNGLQYAGDGASLFLLEGLSGITLETMMRIIDISPEESEEWRTSYSPFPSIFNIEFSETNEQIELHTGLIRSIEKDGDIYIPLLFADRVIFIKKKYMKVCADPDIGLFVRKDRNGRFYVAAEKGMFTNGIILPVDVMKDSENITNMKNAIKNLAEREAELTPKGPTKDKSGRVVFSE